MKKLIAVLAFTMAGCGAGENRTILMTENSTGCYFAITMYGDGDKFMDPPPAVKPLTNSRGQPVCKIESSK